jgi:phage tail sheath protein FI
MEDVSGETQETSATVAAYLKALDIMGRTSDVEIQLLAIPGIREEVVTNEAINTVENRFDAMYVMDIQERDALNAVVTSSLQQPHVQNTVTAFGDRALDTSFGAAYFPNVTMTDPVKNTLVEVPPSVSVMGALALNDKLAHPWFAPAGSTRGVLQTTSDVSVRINQENADRLYSADINPIRKMQNNTVQVFGQKTLMQAQSALDRINVRRLLIDVRRQVRMIANRFLFEPNREATLAAFSATVQPVLQRIQQQQGVDRYKVIIDTTTTTQADVENNTIRGKIFLQPTRAVEFVSLDFVVTNAGAEE